MIHYALGGTVQFLSSDSQSADYRVEPKDGEAFRFCVKDNAIIHVPHYGSMRVARSAYAAIRRNEHRRIIEYRRKHKMSPAEFARWAA